MQLIPGLSTIGNSTNIIPLMIFISISMAKEAFDDYKRHRLDRKENRRETLIVARGAPLGAEALNWQTAQWRYLRVGDIVKLKRDEQVPADIVLLSSSNLGECKMVYVETSALDGETSLKRKQAVKLVAEACSTPERLVTCTVEFIIEDPNSDLSTFSGKVIVDDKICPLTNDHIIYRGSVLRNVSQVTAMVVHSGEECKIRMDPTSNGFPRTKAPHLQSVLNKIVVLVVLVVLGLATYNTVAYQFWKSRVELKLSYLSSAHVPFHEEYFGFIIMFATMVPLSLYVSMEMIKLAQIFFLNSDVDMYEQKSDTPFEARTSTINEDLGQVTHIFSDKTGTLTDNEMKFRKLSIAGFEWTHDDAGCPSQDGFCMKAGSPHRSPSTTLLRSQPAADGNTRELVDYVSRRPDSALAHQAKLMLLCMALCHSCIPETTQSETAIDFQSTSPDELALVRAARDMGLCMRSRDHEIAVLALSTPSSEPIRIETYEILNVIEFSSNRRRMSVIVRFPDGRTCLICKGADSVIMERLRLKLPEVDTQDGASPQRTGGFNDWSGRWDNGVSLLDEIRVEESGVVLEHCIRSVNKFASESLRTLLYAYRFLGEKEYADWGQIWDAAATSLSNREKAIESAADLLEVNFELAGATGIEDKLQEGVVETIDKLSRANIKIWMLTGDKRETAVNIGHSCGLIKARSIILNLTDEDGSSDMARRIRSIIETLETTAHNVVVVDGNSLATIYSEASRSLEALFLDLVLIADSTICCRAQPSQKAQVVSSIRKRLPNSVTLAVGDGANDIAMIQEAHVGIGITGKEGFQAARSSDYSIAQFRFLQKLILVHGRWNYIRTCKYALGTFWKETVFFLTQALFQRWNGFTGTSLYEPSSLGTFNTLFTSLPVMIVGIFEKDLEATTLLAVPELYRTMGQKNSGFNIWIYFGWTAMGVAEAMIIYFCMLTLFGEASIMKDNTLFSMGDLSFVAVVIVVSVKLQIIEMHNKSIAGGISVFLSTGAVFLWNILLAATYPVTSTYKARGGFFTGFGQNPTRWIALVFIVICVYILELSVVALRKAFFPTDTDVFQELERHPAFIESFHAATMPEPRQIWESYSDRLVDENSSDIQLSKIRR